MLKSIYGRAGQRLAAQPLGYVCLVVTILAGILKSQFGVHSLSLGQSLPPRSKTARLCSLSSFGCEAGVGCSRGLGPAPKWDKRMGIYWFYLNYFAKITTSEARLLSPFLGFRRGGSNFRSIIELFLFIDLHGIFHMRTTKMDRPPLRLFVNIFHTRIQPRSATP
jgi:hypothetical protein